MKKIILSILTLTLATLVNADTQHYFAVPEDTDVAGFISSSTNPTLDNTERLLSTDTTETPLFPANNLEEQSRFQSLDIDITGNSTTTTAFVRLPGIGFNITSFDNRRILQLENGSGTNTGVFNEDVEINSLETAGAVIVRNTDPNASIADKITSWANQINNHASLTFSAVANTATLSLSMNSSVNSVGFRFDEVSSQGFAFIPTIIYGELAYYTTTNNAATVIENLVAANPIYADTNGKVAIDIYHFVENTEDSIFNASGAIVYYNSSEINGDPLPTTTTNSVSNVLPNYDADFAQSNGDDDIANNDNDITTDKEFSRVWGFTGGAWDGTNADRVGDTVAFLGYIVACGDVENTESPPFKLYDVNCIGGAQADPDSPQRLFTIDLKLTPTITTTNLNLLSSVSTDNNAVHYNFAINKALPAPVLANHPAQIYTVDTPITTPLRFTNTGGVGLTSCNSNTPLPTGLSVDPSTDVSTCEISGTPSAVSNAITYTITATNSAGSGTATVNITVNPKAPNISLSTTTITAVVGVDITDITVSTNTGGVADLYSISPTLNNGLSFSTTTGVISGMPNISASAAIWTVTATNAGGSGSATLSITVLDNAPTGITLSNDNISENAGANVIVGTLSTTDPDFGTHTYTLASTNTAFFSISDDTLIANNSFDFETQSSYNITVTTTDKGGKPFSKDFIITVNDTDEPIITSTNTFTVLAGETIVATLTATTEDGNTATFSTEISGTNAASFTLTAAGALTFNNPAVYDTYNIIVKSVNANGTATQAITINVLTQSTFNVGTNTITLTENAANTIRHQVNITAIDEDNSASNSTFAVSTTGGIFTTNPAPVVSFSNSSIDSTAALSSTVQTATLYFTVIPDLTGTGTITITLTDENNDVTSKTLTVIVNQTNKTPIISQDIATYIDAITDTISRKYDYQNDAAIFGGSLYFSLNNNNGAKFADFVELQSSFNTDAHIAIIDSEQERLFFNTLSGGSFDTYLGVASGTETGFGIAGSVDSWYSVLGDFVLFDSVPNAPNNGEQIAPGHYDFSFNGGNNGFFADNDAVACLRYQDDSHFNDRGCNDVGSDAIDDGFFELPSGLPATTTISATIDQDSSSTEVAKLTGFDLDGDSITWSYSDSADGTATFTNNITTNAGVSTTTVTYQPAADFIGTTTLSIILTDSNNNSTTMTINITVNPATPDISLSTTTVVASVATAITAITVSNDGGTATYSISPALSEGLSFATTDGTISGTPSATATLQVYTITASNVTNSDSATLSITVNPAAPNISLSTTTITATARSAINNITVTNNGGDATYSISPAIANDLSFNTTDGTISGTPANAATNVVYTVTATNVTNSDSATLSITVNPAAPIISLSVSTLTATAGTAISDITVTNSGGTATYSISPAIANNLSFATDTGTISGTPANAVANVIYTVTATNATNSDSATFSITVNPAAPIISLSVSTLTATARTAISDITVTNSGGTATYSISPAISNNLSFSTETGTISGTPANAAANVVYTVTATNVTNSDSATLSITVNPAAPIISLSVSTLTATAGTAISDITVTNSGGTATYSISPAIANNLSFATDTGTISGTPANAAANVVYTVTATNVTNSDSATLSITVNPAAPIISLSVSTLTATAGTAISDITVTNSGGTATYSISPAIANNLSFATDTGTISGTPANAAANVVYTVTATNATNSDSATLSITVNPAAPIISLSVSTLTATAGTAISDITVTNSGGTATYSISPAIANNLSFATETGTISGTPANAAANIVYTVTATNATNSDSATLSITVNPAAPSIELSVAAINAGIGKVIEPITVINNGGTPTSYAISRSLSAGLSFSTETGTISGTPNTTASATIYTVTATNITGSDSDTVEISVSQITIAPSIANIEGTQAYYAGVMISPVEFTNSGDPAQSCASNLALPAGLNAVVSGDSCAISGTPQQISSATAYTIIATNPIGSDTATINISVTFATPSISVSTTTVVASVATAITAITVSNDGGTATYSISPALSEGLSFSTETGTISGTPSAIATLQVYTITASNVTNSDSATLSITVNIEAPIISLSVSTLTATAGTAISDITVTNSGGTATYSISPAIANNLSFATATGTISGTPANAATNIVYTVTATNVTNSDSATLSITVNPAAPIISLSVSTLTATAGSTISDITVTNSGGTATYSISPAIANNLSFSAETGTISGTPANAATNVVYTVTATNATNSDSATLSITVNPTAPIISLSVSTLTATAGSAISDITVTNSGGTATYSISPAIANNLSFDTTDGTISGTPANAATNVVYTVTATNVTNSDSATFSITVNPAAPSIELSVAAINAGIGKVIEPITVINNGGTPTSYAISRSLSAGLSFSTETGTISGTPSATATAIIYTVTATNITGTDSATVEISVSQVTSKPSIANIEGTQAYYAGVMISPVEFTNSGDPAQSCASNLALPAGLNAVVSGNSCAISGTPTMVSAATTYTITATNPIGSDTATINISVTFATPSISVSTTTVVATAGTAISDITVTNSGGTATYSISPAIANNLSFDTTDGTISGTPANAATNVVYTVTATNATNSDSATFSITVNPQAPNISLSVTNLTVIIGETVDISATNTGGVATYSISPAIANNLSFSTETGTISGTPTAVTVATYTVTASNVSGTDSATIEITVNPPAPIIAFSATATAVVGIYVEISATNTGGVATYSISPAIANNLSFSTETGTISGTPTAVTVATYTVTASNVSGTDSATIEITVNPPAPIIAFSATATAVVGIYVEISATNTGGVATYSISPAIANNLSFSTETGTISGTPTAVTVATYTVTASNVSGTDSATIEITVNPAAPIISLSVSTLTATAGSAISDITVTNSGGTATYSISPAIANNLSFATATGTISGTPANAATNVVYTVTATNVTNSDSATLSITVNPAAPSIELSVAAINAGIGKVIEPITVINNGGTPTSYAISDTLSAGLSFSTTTGTISGTPTATASATIYTVTATNITGTDSATVEISVSQITIAPSITNIEGTQAYYAGVMISPVEFTNSGDPAQSCASNLSLPAGLNAVVSGNSCAISGTPTMVSAATTYTITATNPIGSDTATINISVTFATPSISVSTTTVVATAGTAISDITVTNSGGTATYSISPAIANNLSFDTTDGIISGTPSAIATLQVYTITASNVTNSDSATLSITVNPQAPNISLSVTNLTVIIGETVDISATNTGGVATYSISPAIANNLSFNTETGTISGTPTAVTVATYTVTASNVTGTDSATIEITVNPQAPNISLSVTNLTVIIGETVDISATNTGGVATYSISPAIANNLSFNTETGAISGTPTAVTVATYTVTASNVTGTDSATIEIAVNPAAPIIGLSVSTLTATAGSAISDITVTNSGGSATYSISPAIANNLSFDTTDGTISGTPANAATNIVYTVTATNATNSDSATLSITVNPAAPSIELSVAAINAGIGKVIEPITVINNGGTPTSYAISDTLSAGLSFSTETGTISGTPSATATAIIYTVTATNITDTDSATVTITVNEIIDPPSIANIEETQAYYAGVMISPVEFTNSGDPAQSCASNLALPAGLNAVVSGNSCAISGTPTMVSAATTYTITATNLIGSDTATINISVTFATPSISVSTTTVVATAGTAISDITVTNSGGTATYSISPAIANNLSFDTTDGTISGTPANAATNVVYTVTATNVTNSDSATLSITVNPAAPSIELSVAAINAGIGKVIDPITVINNGGTPTSYAISRSLSAGLSFSTETGTISGTPSATASATIYTVTATNITGTDSATVEISVSQVTSKPSIANIEGTQAYYAGVMISPVEFTNSGDPAQSCASNLALPAGLNAVVSGNSCAISGTPTMVSAATTYTITATNPIGSDTATINISVTFATPSISVSTTTVVATAGTAISDITVTNSGGTATYSISPTLSEGLSFSTETGTISGTPSAIATLQVYTITASNVTNSDSATLSITVNIEAPNISLSTTTITATAGSAISDITVINTGGTATSYAIAPALNVGLSFSTETGTISGTPANAATNAQWTITASNVSGNSTATLSITVNAATTFSLDIDGNGTINAPNDGLIIFKYLLNSNANNLHTTIATDAIDRRKTSAQLKVYLDNAGTILDVDGNGTINAPNDGLIIFKYLLNSNANNLHTTIATDAIDGRKTSAQLKDYLDTYK